MDNIKFYSSSLTIHSLKETILLIDFINGLIEVDDLFDKKKLIYFEPSNYRKKNHYTNKYRYGLKLQLENSDLLIIEQATLRYERKSEKLLTQKYLTESLKYIYDIYKKPILIVSNNNVVSNIQINC